MALPPAEGPPEGAWPGYRRGKGDPLLPCRPTPALRSLLDSARATAAGAGVRPPPPTDNRSLGLELRQGGARKAQPPAARGRDVKALPCASLSRAPGTSGACRRPDPRAVSAPCPRRAPAVPAPPRAPLPRRPPRLPAPSPPRCGRAPSPSASATHRPWPAAPAPPRSTPPPPRHRSRPLPAGRARPPAPPSSGRRLGRPTRPREPYPTPTAASASLTRRIP